MSKVAVEQCVQGYWYRPILEEKNWRCQKKNVGEVTRPKWQTAGVGFFVRDRNPPSHQLGTWDSAVSSLNGVRAGAPAQKWLICRRSLCSVVICTNRFVLGK